MQHIMIDLGTGNNNKVEPSTCSADNPDSNFTLTAGGKATCRCPTACSCSEEFVLKSPLRAPLIERNAL